MRRFGKLKAPSLSRGSGAFPIFFGRAWSQVTLKTAMVGHKEAQKAQKERFPSIVLLTAMMMKPVGLFRVAIHSSCAFCAFLWPPIFLFKVTRGRRPGRRGRAPAFPPSLAENAIVGRPSWPPPVHIQRYALSRGGEDRRPTITFSIAHLYPKRRAGGSPSTGSGPARGPYPVLCPFVLNRCPAVLGASSALSLVALPAKQTPRTQVVRSHPLTPHPPPSP